MEALTENAAAHEMAHKRCYLIHRDVSFGNVLIYPQVGESEDDQCSVVWKGLLADWELAKDYRITKALQPERTVSLLCHLSYWLILMMHVRERGTSCLSIFSPIRTSQSPSPTSWSLPSA